MIAKLVECTDYDTQYGILTVENVSIEDVQQKIYEIKNKFCEENFNDWTIEDVFAEFPEEWVWDFVNIEENEVIEI